ncbi:hypothetical protein cyc_08314 [Cyclospora cayetanensis]|uniref:DNA-directed DNA polymerase X domain-containing protein n=1 Tax=Cyclospora cayetanensis TaxID=88456 RepID=A0A1D3CZQ0_9EIME|nr:hypothetical protein cyc_08314 [Cyclospora cayetanensis]
MEENIFQYRGSKCHCFSEEARESGYVGRHYMDAQVTRAQRTIRHVTSTTADTVPAAAQDGATADKLVESCSDDEPEVVAVSLPVAAILRSRTPEALRALIASAESELTVENQQQDHAEVSRRTEALAVSSNPRTQHQPLPQPAATTAVKTVTLSSLLPSADASAVEVPPSKRPRKDPDPQGQQVHQQELVQLQDEQLLQHAPKAHEQRTLAETSAVCSMQVPLRCCSAGTLAAEAEAGEETGPVLTSLVVGGLQDLAEKYQHQGDTWRALSFQRAAAVITAACNSSEAPSEFSGRRRYDSAAPTAATAVLKGGLTSKNLHLLRYLPGVGPSVMATVCEIAERGNSSRIRVIQGDTAATTAKQQLQLIFGVGPNTAEAWHTKGLSIQSLRRAHQHSQNLQQQSQHQQSSRGLPVSRHVHSAINQPTAAFRLRKEQAISLRYAEAFAVKISRTEVYAVWAFVKRLLLHSPCGNTDSGPFSSCDSNYSNCIAGADCNCLCCSCCGVSCTSYFYGRNKAQHLGALREAICCGSFRRGCEECGDIDLLLLRKNDCANPRLIFRVVELLRQQGLILDDLQYKRIKCREDFAAFSAKAAAQAGAESSEERGTEVSLPGSSPSPIARPVRMVASTRKEKGSSEGYFGICCWPPRWESVPPLYNRLQNTNLSCAAAAAGHPWCRSAAAGCPVCAAAWPGPTLARRIDIKIYPEKMKATALLYFTGCALFNRSSRALAKRLGYSLDDTGLYVVRRDSGVTQVKGFVPCKTEKDIFDALGLEFLPPEKRRGPLQP